MVSGGWAKRSPPCHLRIEGLGAFQRKPLAPGACRHCPDGAGASTAVRRGAAAVVAGSVEFRPARCRQPLPGADWQVAAPGCGSGRSSSAPPPTRPSTCGATGRDGRSRRRSWWGDRRGGAWGKPGAVAGEQRRIELDAWPWPGMEPWTLPLWPSSGQGAIAGSQRVPMPTQQRRQPRAEQSRRQRQVAQGASGELRGIERP